MFQASGPIQNVGMPAPNSQNQLSTIALWVDSVNGNDANPGTQALPLRTYSRALTIRQFWGRGYATFFIHLVGAGPYSSSLSGFDTFGQGTLLVQGDIAAETIHLSGTFTGPAVAGVYPTAAGLGVDAQQGRFLRITSGTNATRELQICENTDTSVTFVTNNGVSAVANGVTFDIFTPGTSISIALTDWVGGSPLAPLAVFHRLRITALSLVSSNIAFASCRCTGSPIFRGGNYVGGTSQNAALNLPLANALFDSGLTIAANNLQLFNRASFAGRLVCANSNQTTVNDFSSMELAGGRFTSAIASQNQGDVFIAGTGTQSGFFRFDGTLEAADGGILRLGNSGNPYGLLKFAVTGTNNSCIRARRGGVVIERLSAANPPSGGAAGAGSFGHDAAGGGRIYIFSGQPALTGIAGDLHITGTTAANATLNAADTAVGAAASLFGDVLARVGS